MSSADTPFVLDESFSLPGAPLSGGRVRGRGNVPRNGNGAPRLYPRDMPKTLATYTSASSLSSYITDNYGINRWQMRATARGFGVRPDLADLAATETWTPGFGPSDEGGTAAEIAEHKASGLRLDDLLREAQQTAGILEKANWGTAVHTLTEPGAAERGSYTPRRMKPSVQAWYDLIKHIRVVATEVFVANDLLMAAGTFDHLLDGDDFTPDQTMGIDTSGTLLVCDKKTGSEEHPEAVPVQTTVYAGGDVYGLGEEYAGGLPLDVRQTFEERYGKPVNQEVGILAHLPARPGPGQPPAVLKPVDLRKGLEAAKHAIWVRDYRRDRTGLGKVVDIVGMARTKAMEAVFLCQQPDEVTAVWEAYKDVWIDEMTEAARQHLAGLS